MTDLGAYVHIPFCSSRCDYCAFATWTDRAHLMEDYVKAVRVEIHRAVEAGGLRAVTSVFVGGGTPSLLEPDDLVAVIGDIPTVAGAEVTIECNPEDVDEKLVSTYLEGGVTRLSLGVQSMVPHVLEALGRRHDPASVSRAVQAARSAGLTRLNLDLIYGARGETLSDWGATIAAAIDLGPDHVSAYALTVESGTPLATDPQRYPEDDDQAEKYLIAESLLTTAGFSNYEISNWSMPGEECRHNLLYWSQGNYLGFGSAAHSHVDGRRWWNVRTPEGFIERIGAGRSAEVASEELDGDRRRVERLQLALRTSAGVPVGSLSTQDRELVDSLLVEREGRLHLTVEGRMLANEVAVRLR